MQTKVKIKIDSTKEAPSVAVEISTYLMKMCVVYYLKFEITGTGEMAQQI